MKIYGITIEGFKVQNKLGKARFFQKIFLVAYNNNELIFKMFFLNFSKIEINFAYKRFTWRTYIIAEAFSTTKKDQIINRKKFAKRVLDLDQKTFVIHVTTFTTLMPIHLARKAQIVILIVDEIPIIIFA